MTGSIRLLRAALEEAGRINHRQGQVIEAQAAEVRRLTNELWDWKQRCRSMEERLTEFWPTDPQVRALREENRLLRAEVEDQLRRLAELSVRQR